MNHYKDITNQEQREMLPNLAKNTRILIVDDRGNFIHRRIIDIHAFTNHVTIVIEMLDKYNEYTPQPYWVQYNSAEGGFALLNYNSNCHGGQPLRFLCIKPTHGMPFSETEKRMYMSTYEPDVCLDLYNRRGQRFLVLDTLGTERVFDVLIETEELGSVSWAYMRSSLDLSDLRNNPDYWPIYTRVHGVEYQFDMNNREQRLLNQRTNN